jgi:hypothetical protein
LPIVHAAATKLFLTPLNLVVWAKTNAGMGSLYRSQHDSAVIAASLVIARVEVFRGGRPGVGRLAQRLRQYATDRFRARRTRLGLRPYPRVDGAR